MHKLCNILWKTKRWLEQWVKAVFISLPKSGEIWRTARTTELSSFFVTPAKLWFSSFRTESRNNRGWSYQTSKQVSDLVKVLGTCWWFCRYWSKMYADSVKVNSICCSLITQRLLIQLVTLCFSVFTTLVARHLVALIQALYQQHWPQWDGELSEWFGIGKGTGQGGHVSPTEYNVYAEDIIEEQWKVIS